jgi:hypothetical protein
MKKQTSHDSNFQASPHSRAVGASENLKLPPSTAVNLLAGLCLLALVTSGCQVLTYRGPNGERFSRGSLGATTAISSLTVEADTNGLRRVDLRGYTNDSTQALGAVTEAAVRAALQSAKPAP